MGLRIRSIAFLLGFSAIRCLSQTDARPAQVFNSEDYKISGVLLVQPPAQEYLKFFRAVKDLGTLPLSDDARKFLRLNDTELRFLLKITASLSNESRVLDQRARQLMFEARLDVVELGDVSAGTQADLHELDLKWEKKILEHVQQLRGAFGEARFLQVDEFIMSGKAMFEKEV
jgi:hypothetical protein